MVTVADSAYTETGDSATAALVSDLEIAEYSEATGGYAVF